MADGKKKLMSFEMEPDLRKRAAIEAARRGVSLGALIRAALDAVVPADIRIVVGAEASSIRRSMKS